MFIKRWKKEILTIPNMLSLFRLALIPVYISVYLNAKNTIQYFTAGSILTISCLTDAIDGKIARRFNMVSTLGKILDPLADKITQLVLTLCLSLKYPILYPVLILFLVKESFQLGMGIYYFRKGKMLSGALIPGKISTTVLFISLTAMVFFPDLGKSDVFFITIINGFFLMFSFVSYILIYLKNPEAVRDIHPDVPEQE